MVYIMDCSTDRTKSNGRANPNGTARTKADATVRPRAIEVSPENIPETLKALPRWFVWKYVEDLDPENGAVEWNKPPMNARTLGAGSSTNAKTWSDYPTALESFRKHKLDGVGFVVYRATGEVVPDGERLVAIDLDKCRNPETSAIDPWAQEIIDKLASYTEVSPSGRGIRIFIFADLPPHGRKKGHFECYQSGRYVTVTGARVAGTPQTIEHRQNALAAIHLAVFGPEKSAAKAASDSSVAANLPDHELIQVVERSKIANKFRALWQGGADGNPSASEGDLALCSYLAFFCGPDEGRIDAFFRSSARMRPKWDQLRGDQTYGARTIAKALEGKTKFYRGNGHAAAGHGASDTEPADQKQRPTIPITTSEYSVNDLAVKALAKAESLFQRANALVVVRRDEARTKGIERPPGSPQIVELPQATLREVLTKVADWRKPKAKKKGEVRAVPAHPPTWCVAAVAARGQWPGIRHLEAVVEAPTLRRDGTLLSKPGWDERTGVFYAPNANFEPVHESLTREQAVEASRQLLDLVEDFPFAGEAHKGAWLASLLTPAARFAIDGPCPCFVFDASTPGSGKGQGFQGVQLLR
jgi:primase-polymerase (primpol)-like protein